jgi:hypothetical protein
VSILNRLIPNRHLTDAALAEIWSASAAGGDPASPPHLLACAACRSRYDAFAGWLDDVRGEATGEADAAFPPERLAAQQAQILKRLEAMERPVRVIAFPKFAQPIADRPSIAHRWIAVAAAAGLVIGLALGQWLDFAHRFDAEPAGTLATSHQPSLPEGVTLQTVNRAISDEALLSELDADFAMTPTVDPLRAIDTITPRSRDFSDGSR